MSSDLGVVVGLAFLAMLNPSLVAATTLMLLLPHPRLVMLGYLLGAYATGIGVGLAIVFSLQNSSFASTAKHTVSPSEQIVVGVILLLAAFILATDRDVPVRERRQRRRDEKAREPGDHEPWSQRLLGRGSVGIAFLVGALLSFPGVSFLTALGRIAKVDPGTTATVFLVIGFVLVQLVPLEIPLLGYAFAPDKTRALLARFRAWVSRHGRRAATIAAVVLGALLIVQAVLNTW